MHHFQNLNVSTTKNHDFLEKQRSKPGPKNPYNHIESMVYLSTLMVDIHVWILWDLYDL